MVARAKIIFGAASFGNRDPYQSDEDIKQAFSILDKHGVKILDSAQLYGNSQVRLGEVRAGQKYTIDTKWQGGFGDGGFNKEKIVETAKDSIQKLGVDKVDIFYIHAPDHSVPLEDTLAGVNEVYKLGLFQRFGLSNFPPSLVQNVLDICQEKSFVLPQAYQVNYSAVARKPEDDLFPLLRKFNIAIYAYSPIAGGLLAKSKQQVLDGSGRFNKESIGGLYQRLYTKPSYLAALDKWEKIAEDAGVSRAELAYRWTAYHSALKTELGDGVIIGASSFKQLDETLEVFERGPLPEKAAKAIDDLWADLKPDAPYDNFNN